jgi:hypothetical protein
MQNLVVTNLFVINPALIVGKLQRLKSGKVGKNINSLCKREAVLFSNPADYVPALTTSVAVPSLTGLAIYL